jgi:hypothetical protein
MSLPVTCKRCMALSRANGNDLDFTVEERCPEEGLCFQPLASRSQKNEPTTPPKCPDEGLCFDENDAEFWLIRQSRNRAIKREVCPFGVSCPRNFGDY